MTNDNENKVNNPHNALFINYFSRQEVVLSFLQENLPKEILDRLDMDSLKISSDTFIDEHLSDYASDMVYEIMHDGLPLLVYLLFEHKSYNDPMVAFQLLKYMVRIWEHYIKQQEKQPKKLPVILPMVIYHGPDGWTAGDRFENLFHPSEDLKEFIPDFRFQFHDWSHIPEGKIRGVALLQALILTFKYSRSPALVDRLDDIFKLFNDIIHSDNAMDSLRALLVYLSKGVPNVTYDLVDNSLKRAIDKGGDIMPTIADTLRKEGYEEGVESGDKRKTREVVQRMLSERFPDDMISKISGLPLEEINRIKQSNATH